MPTRKGPVAHTAMPRRPSIEFRSVACVQPIREPKPVLLCEWHNADRVQPFAPLHPRSRVRRGFSRVLQSQLGLRQLPLSAARPPGVPTPSVLDRVVRKSCQAVLVRLASRAAVAAARLCASFARRASRRRIVFSSRDRTRESSSSTALLRAKNCNCALPKATSACWRDLLNVCAMVFPGLRPDQCGNKKGQAICLTLVWYHALNSASTSVVKGKPIPGTSGSLEIAG